ncbi:MAG: hypothetical protein ABR501_02195 [Pyrinomonadaceae bacterium]
MAWRSYTNETNTARANIVIPHLIRAWPIGADKRIVRFTFRGGLTHGSRNRPEKAVAMFSIRIQQTREQRFKWVRSLLK